MKHQTIILTLGLSLMLGAAISAHALDNKFNYQGRLTDNSIPATASYRMQFRLRDGPSDASTVLAVAPIQTVPVVDGLFNVLVDFPVILFDGNDRWLEISVASPATPGTFIVLLPRQQITPTPYALYAAKAGGFAEGVPLSFASKMNFNAASGPPFGVLSAVKVDNLNSDRLDGLDSGDFWQPAGNAITPGKFLGTINNQPLELRVNNAPALRLVPNATSPNLIGGAAVNAIGAGQGGSVIGGGGAAAWPNYIGGDYDVIGGGQSNNIFGGGSVIAGGGNNLIDADTGSAAIGGGRFNRLGRFVSFGTIAGGFNNAIETNSLYATISGGANNRIQTNAPGATIGGGENNLIRTDARDSVIGGGTLNDIQVGSDYSVVAGGSDNSILTNSEYSAIGGGLGNSIEGFSALSVVGGGGANVIGGDSRYSVIVGGSHNTIEESSDNSTIGGGRHNSITLAGSDSVIAGGGLNWIASADQATVSGGFDNSVGTTGSTIGGGLFNVVPIGSAFSAVIAGGQRNTNAGNHGVISGGNRNVIEPAANILASTIAPVISGGSDNVIQGLADYTTIGGGRQNAIYSLADYGTVGGGVNNVIGAAGLGVSLSGATIAGGDDNSINLGADNATIGGGKGNRVRTGFGGISSTGATIPGGINNEVAGWGTFAAGQRAKAVNPGSFVWADSTDADFSSTAQNQFCIRAGGGVVLNPATSLYCGSQVRQMLNLWSTAYGIGVQGNALYLRSNADFSWFRGGIHNDNRNNPGGGTELMRLDANGNLTLLGVIFSPSDRNLKENFQPVNAREVLAKVAALPLSRWNYKTDEARSVHLGPMAQDFHAAFALGTDDKHIATIDADGVALAAIQGLHELVQEKDARISSLEQRLASMEKAIASLSPAAPIQAVNVRSGGAR